MSKEWPHYKLTTTRYRIPARYDLGVKVADECNIYFGMQAPGIWRFVVEIEGKRVWLMKENGVTTGAAIL